MQLVATRVMQGPQVFIQVTGEIAVGDSYRFLRLARDDSEPAGVVLQSPGGSADDGLAMAKFIHEHKLDTVVTGTCHSICSVMFLAGRNRYLGPNARVTVHSAYKQLGDWVVEDHQANATIAWFIGHMGYPLQLARLWAGTPTDQAAEITPKMNADLKLGLIMLEATPRRPGQLVASCAWWCEEMPLADPGNVSARVP